jgi:hypothetical protein
MSQMQKDSDLNKAALVIAKLLLRTREGKIQWTTEQQEWASLLDLKTRYETKLSDDLKALISRQSGSIDFELIGPPAIPISKPLTALMLGQSDDVVIHLSLSDTFAAAGVNSPEGIVYRDLQELLRYAENPKLVSDDLRLKQAMNILDKLDG